MTLYAHFYAEKVCLPFPIAVFLINKGKKSYEYVFDRACPTAKDVLEVKVKICFCEVKRKQIANKPTAIGGLIAVKAF